MPASPSPFLAIVAAAVLCATGPSAAAQPSARYQATMDALMRDLTQAGEDLAGEALAQWIWVSRNDAVKAGVAAIPVPVRAQLNGYFPAALLDRVRYRVGAGHELGLPANAFKTEAVAITLDDVIMFRPGQDVETSAKLWAHELTHVQQYERWGVRGFARRYTQDHLAVEQEADTNATKFAAVLASRR